jgi:hypothetical protein
MFVMPTTARAPASAARAELPTERAKRLVEELAAQAAQVEAGVCRLLELVAECREHVDWGGDGTTFAAWLAWQCSLSPRQAREYERVAARLDELPEIHDAFACGELCFAKTSAVMLIAEPETEPELLELAKATTVSQLNRAAGAYRALSLEQAADQQAREFVHHHWTEDGLLAMRAQLTTDNGALMLRALDAARDALWNRDSAVARILDADQPAGFDIEPARPSNAEALVAIADLALTGAAGDRPSAERYQVVVHVDARTLAEETDARCELADGQQLSVETARRLSCDASVVELLERDGEPLSLGRRRRTISAALRRALTARDRGCRFPGCDRTRFVDGHHIRHWSQGGSTDLNNLVSLCRRHHRLVHERGYSVRFDDSGEVRFTNEYGITAPNAPRPPRSSPEALREQNRRRGLAIDSSTGCTGYGDPMDLGCAVDAIASIVKAARAGPSPVH